MENLNIKLDNPSQELIIRTGTALPLTPPKKIVLTGNISAISNFLAIRGEEGGGTGLQRMDGSRAVVIANHRDMTLHLFLDPENEKGTEVIARLELSDELKAFHINSQRTFTREELVKLIRFNKMWFEDGDKHSSILSSYMAFDATANTNIAQAGDTRGNKANHITKAVTTNVPTEFILKIPIFKGGNMERFRVEICLDVTDGGARFWFESVELHEVMIARRDDLLSSELLACDGLVIIYQ